MIPAPSRSNHPVTTRRAWVVGYAVESTGVAPHGEHDGSWARDAARGAERLDSPRGGYEFERSLRIPPPLEVPPVHDPYGWHQPGMPLPTSALLAMRDATRHLR